MAFLGLIKTKYLITDNNVEIDNSLLSQFLGCCESAQNHAYKLQRVSSTIWSGYETKIFKVFPAKNKQTIVLLEKELKKISEHWRYVEGGVVDPFLEKYGNRKPAFKIIHGKVEAVFCTQCGQKHEPTAIVCKSCGKPLPKQRSASRDVRGD